MKKQEWADKAQILSEKSDSEGYSDFPESIFKLIGEWRSEEAGRITTESWIQVSAVTLEGIGRTMSADGRSPESGESLRIVAMCGDVFYIAKVTHNPLPVAFRLTATSSRRLVFENRQHDFPKKITYSFVGVNQLRVLVGDADGGFELVFNRSATTPDR